jgi:hypothetical protein
MSNLPSRDLFLGLPRRRFAIVSGIMPVSTVGRLSDLASASLPTNNFGGANMKLSPVLAGFTTD